MRVEAIDWIRLDWIGLDSNSVMRLRELLLVLAKGHRLPQPRALSHCHKNFVTPFAVLTLPHFDLCSSRLIMKKITPFDIPILNNEICQYLSRKDLACCALASRAWAAWFTPTLWRDLNCRYRMIDVPTFSRHREHIRVLRNVSMENGRAIRDQLPFLQLQRLEFGDNSNNYGVHRTEMRVLPALETISTLQHLQITLSLDRDNVFQQWIRTLKNLFYLEPHPEL